MRTIRLPEPPSGSLGMPEIFEGGVYSVIRRAVVIGNGFAGSENQSIGLVRALGLGEKHSLYRVSRPQGGINEWLHWLPVSLHKKLYYVIRRICGDSRFAIILRGKKLLPFPSQTSISSGLASILDADAKRIAAMARETFEKDGPLLVVASGRDTINIASSIKRLAPENVFVVQIQHPRTNLSRFDLVIAPRHDYYPLTPQAQEQIPRFLRSWITPREPPNKNVLTVGALHQADFGALRAAAAAWHDELAPLPKPLLVVNIGGPTSHCRYGADLAKELIGSLQNVLASCGSLRISFSRRTPQKVSNILKELGDHPKVSIWDGEEPNPHMGHLAWADAFVITADSVSMLSEACGTGKPVYVIGAERCTWKFEDFHRSLQQRGVARRFTGKEDISESWSYPPLNDTAEAARRVQEAIAEPAAFRDQKGNTVFKSCKNKMAAASAAAPAFVIHLDFSHGQSSCQALNFSQKSSFSKKMNSDDKKKMNAREMKTETTKVGSAPPGVVIANFFLRLAGIVAALAAATTMGTTDQTLPFFTQFFQFRATFDDLPALTFFVIANAIASAYLVLSLSFSVATIIRPHLAGAKMLLNVFDTVMVALTTAGAASAAAIVYLAHNGNSSANWVAICQQFNGFCQRISGAVVASFVAVVIFMVLLVMSALSL
ncbi:Uncharacterized protein family UPF0497 [Macleaya cordata]|uniref:Uncharacterized protein family UPF0497 n=1 Tax=Macleaya cordata TaxID=56857 RepID=A0A200QHS2_MACCD|nr:Uncharacterized protein family UPF0497 [Macleaya cordata]